MRALIAGGGTGGHLFPGIAIAEELMKRIADAQILFVGTQRGLEGRLLPALGWPLACIDIEGILGRGWRRALEVFCKVPAALAQSFRILRAFRPDVVVGVGGYASGPVLLMAWLLRLPTAIAEQNAIPGVTNRILGRLADRVFVSFPETQAWFSPSKTLVTGNPVRGGFLSAEPPCVNGPFSLLVFGGSQGARAINRAMIDALETLGPLGKTLAIVHQTGPRDLDEVAQAYRRRDIPARVVPFLADMASAFRSAHLLVCRAGATTVAEITASGKAAILIPFAHAANDHQTKNAAVLVRAGAAVMLPEKNLDGHRLAEAIRGLAEHPERVRDMAVRAQRLGRPQAAAEIVDACLLLRAA